jgi:hypothetical protein
MRRSLKRDAFGKTVRLRNERYEEWHIAVGRSGKQKKPTQGDDGFRKNLAAAAGQWTTVPFLHRERDIVVRGQAETMLQEKLLKDGRSRGENRHARKAAVEQETEN